ncbi:MAG: BtrH N-terminal domain-containing protein [Colwellia sp.]|nr:BtrH N-terminal domain-containing protein [Colwellia sp.]
MTLIKNTHVPGVHCSSTAVADLVRFHGFNWSEDFCFGIGGGLGITYLKTPQASPTRLLHTRSLGYEKRFFNAIGIDDFSWLSAETEEESEQQLITALNENRPALLLTDIYYLHYFNSSSHFPGHGIMAWSYNKEDQVFHVTDTERENVETVSFEKMRKARVSQMIPFICNGDFYAPQHLNKPTDLKKLCQQAIKENALRLLKSTDQTTSFPALEALSADLSEWQHSNDWQWNCRFAYQTIEKRGTGGSGFRKMYARFLGEASQYLDSIKTLHLEDKMHKSAQSWYELSTAFKHTSENDDPNFEKIKECIKQVITDETHYCEAAILV